MLGVSTAAYFPFCFFNILSPLIDVLYGYLGFKVPTADRPWADDGTNVAPEPGQIPTPKEAP